MLFNRASISPLFSILFVMLGTAFLMTYLSVRLDDLGYGNMVIGTIQGAFYAGMLAGALIGPWLKHRLGNLGTDLSCVASLTICILLMAIWTHPINWIIWRFIQGIAVGVLMVVAEAWLLANHSTRERGQILGWYATSLYVGQTLSQPILSFLNWGTNQPFFVSAALCAVAFVPVAVGYVPKTVQELEIHHPWTLIHKSPLGSLTGLLSGVVLASLYAFAPVYADDTALSPVAAMTILILGGVLAQWPLGWLGDRWPRRAVLTGMCLTLLILTLLIWLFPLASPLLRLVLLFFIGSIAFSLYPVGLAIMADRLSPQQLIGGAALLNLLYGIGAVVGPVVAPFLLDPLSTTALFLFIALWAALIAILGLFRTKIV